MGYDDVIPLLGGFGRYQRRIYFLLCLPAILCAFHKLANVFLQAKPNFRCQLPHELGNASYSLPFDVLNASYPKSGANGTFASCSMLKDDKAVECDNYIFDHSIYKSTTVTEWNLVCEKTYMKALGDAIFMFGVMVGSIGFGGLSDRFGRRIIFFIAIVVQVVFGILAAIAPEYWTFTICRAIVGSTTSGGIFLVAYVIAMEMVGPRDRLVAGTVCHMFFSLGYVLTAGFAYFITDWRYLQVALTLPCALFLCYWWFIPESARWLVTNNRVKEATELIQAAAKENKIQISNAQIEELLTSDTKQEKSEKRATLLDIFKHPNLRTRSLLIFFDWFANNITYYGLSWNTSNLGGNDYVNFVIAGFVEIPGYTFLLLTLNRWGRKAVLCGSMITAGIVLLLTAVVPEEPVWIIITLAMIGKLTITAGYGTVYIFSAEQFPTVIRNAGMGACSTFARVGSILAPIINLTTEVWKPLPMVIFGICALIGGGLSLFLPETLNRELPETISDSENFSRNRKPQNIAETKESEPLKVITSNGVIEETKS